MPVVRAELKVLALIDHLGLGGAEMLLGQFAAAAPSAGIRLSVACLAEFEGNPAAARLRSLSIEPFTLDAPERLGLGALRAVRRHISHVGPDILHTHLGSSGLLGSIAARSLGVPAVVSVHGIAWNEDMRTRVRLKVGALAQRHGASRIITVSEAARCAYLARGWDSPERVVAIHNGIDVVQEHGARAAVRHELGLGFDAPVLGMFSRLRREKGHDVAIAAVQLLRPRYPDLRLVIAGDGPLRADLARRVEPLGEAVVMTGPRFDVMRLFDATDLCLQPSRDDAFPTTLLEAMAASVPVIASDAGGIPEIVVHNQTGVLVPAPPTAEQLAEAIASLLENPTFARKLADAGRQRYEERFTVEPWVQRTRTLYDSVLSELSTATRGDERSRVRAALHGTDRNE